VQLRFGIRSWDSNLGLQLEEPFGFRGPDFSGPVRVGSPLRLGSHVGGFGESIRLQPLVVQFGFTDAGENRSSQRQRQSGQDHHTDES
jgi:hypothetical protein